ncbi:MAG: mechanosensitive ion channel [Rhodospirillales bacterium]
MENAVAWLDPVWIENVQMQAEHWLLTEVLTWTSLVQLAVVALGALVAWPLARPVRHGIARVAERSATWDYRIRQVISQLPGLAFPAVYFVLMLIAVPAAASAGFPSHIMTIAMSLLAAWLVIKLAVSVISNREIARTITATAWTIAALNIVGLLDPLINVLDGLAIPLDEGRISLLTVIKAVVLLVVLWWLSSAAGRFVTTRLKRSQTLTPSIKVLAEKTIKIGLLAAVILVTLDYIGVDLTAFAVFTGALGVGLGFGLQKVVSNLISGFILLIDRSIKPGDVIEIGETFGWVTSLGARYVALTTRDGREWLIPNEDLITQQVINWSYSNKLLRLPMRFGISYQSDVKKAMALAVEVAKGVDRVYEDPAPVCRLIGFGDSSVDFELRIWISDPEGGVVNVKSAVYVALWEAFHENGIELPYPQRDIHIKPGSKIEVQSSAGD